MHVTMHVAVVALGGWGDALPAAILADGLLAIQACKRASLVVSACFRTRLRALLPDSAVDIQALEVPVVVEHKKRSREVVVDSALAEMKPLAALCSSLRADVLVANLYSLAAVHISEALGIPCCVISCGAPMPSSGSLSSLRSQLPVLCAKLRKQAQHEASRSHSHSSDADVDSKEERGAALTLTQFAVEHWMLPLWDAPYRALREHLSLPVPYLAAFDVDSAALPPAIPLLYLVSPTLVPTPSFWPHPAIVRICGDLPLSLSHDLAAADYQPPRELAEFLSLRSSLETKAAAACVVCFGFGSMAAALLSAAERAHLLAVCAAAAKQAGRRALVQGLGSRPAESKDCFCLDGDVPHAWLFPRCELVVHHGGAGTVAAAIRCERAQVVCAFTFDQPFWADRVQYLGIGAALRAADLLPPAPPDESADSADDPAGSAGSAGSAGAGEGKEPAAKRRRVEGSSGGAGSQPEQLRHAAATSSATESSSGEASIAKQATLLSTAITSALRPSVQSMVRQYAELLRAECQPVMTASATGAVSAEGKNAGSAAAPAVLAVAETLERLLRAHKKAPTGTAAGGAATAAEEVKR